jgi:histidinol-phosphatase
MKLALQQAEELMAFAHKLADAAGAITLRYFRKSIEVENKLSTGFDPVTLADKGAEEAMRALIEQTYPEHGVLGEEHGHAPTRNGLTWVIDPIDGTRSFISGSPLWGTLIALSDDEGPFIGILDQPFLRERFCGLNAAGKRKALYAHGGEKRPLKTRACTRLADAALSTTTPEMFTRPPEHAAFTALTRAVRLQRYGGDCYQYGLLAYGFLDLVVEAELRPYDIQALMPIIEGAGGVVSTWEGGSAKDGGRIIAAGDPRAHEAALKVLQSAA